jgi:hypothetical protein
VWTIPNKIAFRNRIHYAHSATPLHVSGRSAWFEKLPKGSEITLIWEGRREKYGRLLGRVITPEGQYMAETYHRAGYWTQDIL